MKITQPLAAIALVLAAAGAHAGPNVQWSISIGVPFPAPVVVAPPVVYAPPPPPAVVYAPYPVYGPPAVVYAPAPVVYRSHRHAHWDADRDGIPDRYDRRYNPRWDVDGDRVPNRYDRRPYNPRY